jgi:predicted dehydrogenase
VHLLDLLLQLSPASELVSVAATSGFWGTGVEEDVVATFAAGAMLAAVRVSHVRWVNTFRIEVVGADGYYFIEGRGGNYGAMRARTGSRWAWHDDPAGRTQRETEAVFEFGLDNRSLEEELAAVLARWLASPTPPGSPEPASMAEARRVTELSDRIYAAMQPAAG